MHKFFTFCPPHYLLPKLWQKFPKSYLSPQLSASIQAPVTRIQRRSHHIPPTKLWSRCLPAQKTTTENKVNTPRTGPCPSSLSVGDPDLCTLNSPYTSPDSTTHCSPRYTLWFPSLGLHSRGSLLHCYLSSLLSAQNVISFIKFFSDFLDWRYSLSWSSFNILLITPQW